MSTALYAESPLNQISTHTFSAGTATVLVVLAICGLVYLFTQSSQARNVALLLVAGVFIVDSNWGQSLGSAVRDAIVSTGNAFHLPQLVTGTIFTVLILVALVIVGSKLKKHREKGTATAGWYVGFFILLLVFFTFSWAQEFIVWLSQWAVKLLDVLSQI